MYPECIAALNVATPRLSEGFDRRPRVEEETRAEPSAVPWRATTVQAMRPRTEQLHQRLGLARSERYGATAGMMVVDADSGVFCTGVLGSDSCSLSHPQDGVRASKREGSDGHVGFGFVLVHSLAHQPTATEAPEIACAGRSRMAMNSGWDLTSRAGVPAR